MQDTYFLPVRFAYEERTPFWEVVYCYGTHEDGFELTSGEFIVANQSVLDPETLAKYLSNARDSQVVVQLGSEENVLFQLKDKPRVEESVPKPQDFVVNDWLHKLLTLDPIGRRALWLLNFLIRSRWECLSNWSFSDLVVNLESRPFSYSLPELKESLDLARGKKTEAPKEPLQLLWKMNIIRPMDPNTFKAPHKGQKWEFKLDLGAFAQEAFRQPEPDFVAVIAVDIVCQILSSRRRQLEEAGYNPAAQPVPLDIRPLSQLVHRIISEQNLKLPLGVELEYLVEQLCQALAEQDIITIQDNDKVILKSGRLGNRYETRPIQRQIVGHYLRQLRTQLLEDTMQPFLAHRSTSLAQLVLNMGQTFDIPDTSCVDLFLFMQERSDHLPESSYEDFVSYCEDHVPLLKFGIGFREVFDGFIDSYKPIPRLTRNIIKRVQKEVLMNQAVKEVTMSPPIPPQLITWARLRRVLSLTGVSSLGEFALTPLTIELMSTTGQLIYGETVLLLNLPKEEIAPTRDLSEELRGAELPLLVRLTLPQVLRQLTIQLILEVAA